MSLTRVTGQEIQLTYKPRDLNFKDTRMKMEFDLYIASLSLAFECHGEQHYRFHFLQGPQEPGEKRDQEKKQLAKSMGITLIEVPYWWDK
jgi:hypothetical protein